MFTDIFKTNEKTKKIILLLLPIVAILAFAIYTLPKAISEVPFFDSAWGWYLSKIINFDNWKEILYHERHCIIWYLILKPFSTNDFFYPYSLNIINWLFCFSAIIFMWKKAPFGNVLKIIITFSFIFTQYFAVIARCYSIGILGMFILLYMQPKSLKHPYLYSLIMGLTANTSAMATIPVSALALIFLYDVIKNKLEKKKIIISFLIFASFLAFLLMPFAGASGWVGRNFSSGVLEFKVTYNVLFLSSKYPLMLLISYFGVLFYIIFLAKEIKAKFFLIYTLFSISCLMAFVYGGTITHKMFLFVYPIYAMWLQNSEFKYKKIYPLICLLSAVLYFIPLDISELKADKSNHVLGTYMKQKGNLFENSYIVFEEADFKFNLLPYILQNNTITILDDNPDYMLNIYMRRFDGLEKYLEFSKKNNKPLFFIAYEEHPEFEEHRFIVDLNEENLVYRYVYKFEPEN